MPKNSKLFFIYCGLLITLLITIVFSLKIGSTHITFFELYQFIFENRLLPEDTKLILYEIRLPRIVLALLVGISLSVAGVILQGVFRNPLVDPFIIGISGGASLGAGIAIIFEINFSFLGISSLPLIAFISSIICLFIAYKLGTKNGIIFIERLLLAGVAISSLTSAILSLLLVVNGKNVDSVIFWIMGDLSSASWSEIKLIIPYLLISVPLVIFNLKNLNIMKLGEIEAENLGVNTYRTKITLIFLSAVISAAVVSISGVIGFIGLIIPQISRILIKSSDYRLLLPVVILLGPIILIISDTMARTLFSPQEIPVGIFTSMLGVPFFLFLLRNKTN